MLEELGRKKKEYDFVIPSNEMNVDLQSCPTAIIGVENNLILFKIFYSFSIFDAQQKKNQQIY